MKNIFVVLAIAALTISVLSFSKSNEVTNEQSAPKKAKFEIPSDVQSIINNSCYGCHNSDSQSTKGKSKLKFDKMPNMKTGKLVGKLSKISKILKKGEMPPEKFLEYNPDKALSKEDSDVLVAWADEATKKLSGE